MAANRSHHFVPKFYLRNFSNDKKSVGTFHFGTNQFLPSASISGQCQRNYFYGRDQIRERGFQTYEDAWAPLFKAMLGSNKLFATLTVDHLFMLLFVVMQRGRTPAAAEELAEMQDKLSKAMIAPKMKKDGLDPKILEKFRIGCDDPVAEALALHTRNWPLLTDLRPILLFDIDGVGFVTSDQPVIYANQLLQNVDDRGTTGVQTPGLQIFVPLSASVLLMLYDADAYFTTQRSPNSIGIGAADVEAINALQIVYASENIYFNAQISNREFVEFIVKKYRKERAPEKSVVTHSAIFRMNDMEYQDTHIVYSRRPSLTLSFSFIRTLKRGRALAANYKRNAMARRPDLIALHDEFERGVAKGIFKSSDLFKWVVEAMHPEVSNA